MWLKFVLMAVRIAANQDANQNHAQQPAELRRGENILHNLPGTDPVRIASTSAAQSAATPTSCAVDKEIA